MKETEVTVGKKGNKNTVASEMQKKKKKVSKQGAVNCIQCLGKVKMGTGKYFWDLKIELG